MFSDELKIEISELLKDYPELKERLLLGEVGAISEILHITSESINPEEIVEAYENNNMESIYAKAKRLADLRELYKKLCNEYYNWTKEEKSKNVR